jgi:Second Messenger Oligonucleotide or Dinucleotide Synthetase domain
MGTVRLQRSDQIRDPKAMNPSVPGRRRLSLNLSVSGAFELFASRLEISDLQQGTVSGRQQAVRAALERRLTVLDSFLMGSYRRHTMISPLSSADIDVFCVLDPACYGPGDQRALLERVRAALRITYPSTPAIRPDGQAVTVRFTDFEMDVVPGFYREGGGFLIPSVEERRWIETDPKGHEKVLARANAAHGGKLVPVVKMIKAWNRNHGSRLHSFYLELMTEAILRGRRIGSYAGAVGFVFGEARQRVRWKAIDPSGLNGGEVNGISIGSVEDAVGLFDRSFRVALEAERLEEVGLPQRSKERWRGLLGSPFPGA